MLTMRKRRGEDQRAPAEMKPDVDYFMNIVSFLPRNEKTGSHPEKHDIIRRHMSSRPKVRIMPGLTFRIAKPFRIITSLRAKLLIIFAILTTIPLSIVGIVSYSGSFSALQDHTINSATQLADQLTKNIEMVFRDSEKFLMIGNHETTISFLNPYRQSEERTYRLALQIIDLFKLFRNIYEFDERIKGIYILGFNGNNISEREGRFRLNREITSIPTVHRILSRPGEVFYVHNGEVDYSADPIYRDVISVGRAIVRPVTHEVMGVIIIDVDTSSVRELCRTIKIGDTGYFSVVTNDRRFIYPPGDTIREDDVAPGSIFRIANEKSGSLIDDSGSEKELLVFNTLEPAGWKIVGRVRLREIMKSADGIRSLTVSVILMCILFTIILYFFISDVLTHPLRDLKDKMKQAESGNLEVQAVCSNRDEVADLCHSFNLMIGEIKDLLARSIKEQEDLKKFELKALQAQINPHFLYNTLDAIIWMTEANNKTEVVRITKALSSFFRIALSKGREWISIRDEFEHIRNYLMIQKIRHRDVLEYDVFCDERIQECRILKLTLQPIVENAIEHGIKNKRGGGRVGILGRLHEDGTILLEVTDDGIGVSEERMGYINAELEDTIVNVTHESGFGLKNVNQRIRLYYGPDWGITISSAPGAGTRVSVRIPAWEQEE